jgi:predicted outer membrane repeat protein
MVLKPQRGVLFLLVLLCLCHCGDSNPAIPGPVPAAVLWRVLPDSAGDWPTIQQAIDHAEPGDTVAVAEGVFRERLLVDKPLYLLGGWDPDFTAADPETRATTLDGESLGTVVTLRNLPDTAAVFDGFVVIHGGNGKRSDVSGGRVLRPRDTPPGSGIYCDNASPIISRNTIRDNAAVFGAGILCHRGAAVLRHNDITGNVAGEDGGGILCLEFEGTLEGNRVSENVATETGGGVYLSLSNATLRGDQVFDNEAGSNGGGMVCLYSGVEVDSVIVRGNRAAGSGGGLLIEGGSALSFRACEILENEADGRGGGAFCRDEAAPTFSSCVFRTNSAGSLGGAVYSAGEVTLVLTRVEENEAEDGGGVVCGAEGWVAARRCFFDGNAARTGGAVRLERNSRSSFFRNTLVNNQASVAAAGFYLVGGESILEANLIVDSPQGEAIYCWTAASVEILRNDVWNNAGGNYGGTCLEPPDPDPNGNFSADPLFCDPGAGNYNLQASSPAVTTEGDTLGAFPVGCALRKGGRR